MALTSSQRRGLEILRDHGPINPKRFADRMWPDSEGHKRPAKCGAYGSHRGGGMYLAAGGFLGRLRKRGLAEAWLRGGLREYAITDDGSAALSQSEGSAGCRGEGK